jgi:hypothetical protein
MQTLDAIKILKAHRTMIDDPALYRALNIAVTELKAKEDREAIRVRKDCFAYQTKDGREDCTALKELYCRNEQCSFYKGAK